MPAPASLLVFAKAAIAGGAERDLFAAPRPVVGHMRGGHFVVPHQATRHLAEAPPVSAAPPIKHLHGPATTRYQGLAVRWPDEAHARLFHMGLGLEEGQEPPEGEVKRLWAHFRGMVDSDHDRPFTEPDHVLDLAREYASPEWGPRAELGTFSKRARGTFEAGDVVSTEAQPAYWRRATQHYHRAMAKALESGMALILKGPDQWSS